MHPDRTDTAPARSATRAAFRRDEYDQMRRDQRRAEVAIAAERTRERNERLRRTRTGEDR